GPEPRAAGLALTVDRVHRVDLHVEDGLDGDLDLGLVRPGIHLEGVLALLVHQPVALLGDDRVQQDVTGILVQRGHFDSSWSASEAGVSTSAAAGAVARSWAKDEVGRDRVACATKSSSAPEVNTTSSQSMTS